MPYKFQPDKMYMLPTHFGPSMGPRQGPEGRRFECKDNPKTTSVSVSFLTNREQLEELLPERFEVGAEPVVTVSVSYMKEIEWLAGHGYNVLGVSFPAVFDGENMTPVPLSPSPTPAAEQPDDGMLRGDIALQVYAQDRGMGPCRCRLCRADAGGGPEYGCQRDVAR